MSAPLKAPRRAMTVPSTAKKVAPGLFRASHNVEVSGIGGARVKNKRLHKTAPVIIVSVSQRPSRAVKDGPRLRGLAGLLPVFLAGGLLKLPFIPDRAGSGKVKNPWFH